LGTSREASSVTVRIICADVMDGLRQLPDESVHCVVSSPPYWGLRDYGVDGQIGVEPTYQEHVDSVVAVFREVRRVLRKDGTLWLNYGDSYATSVNGRSAADTKTAGKDDRTFRDKPFSTIQGVLKPKDLCGIPWRVAFALQADGWWLRSDIIWAKPTPMPESITDRPTKSHEYVFLLTKAERYFYDAEAIKEATTQPLGVPRLTGQHKADAGGFTTNGTGNSSLGSNQGEASRNKRSVWTIATSPFPEAHFATFPPELPEICILAGTSQKGCCAKCGAPWGRATEKIDTGRRQKMADGWDTAEGGHGTVHRNGREKGQSGVPVMASVTTGWEASCSCNADAIPCTVLDPFSGAGTTALVADRLQRNAIGIELNPTYAAMSERRINGDRGALLDLMEAAE
jgi:DNA modification methylase